MQQTAPRQVKGVFFDLYGTLLILGDMKRAWSDWIDPEARAVLSALAKNRTLALISNFDQPPHVHRILSETGLAAFFKTIVVSGDVGSKKPDPEIFRIALKRTDLRADDVVYVGDTQEDVDGAKAAGIRPILIARADDPRRPRILDYTRKDEQIFARKVTIDPVSTSTIQSLREIVGLIQDAGKTNVQ